MPNQNSTLRTEYKKSGGMDFCQRCRNLHKSRSKKIKMGVGTNEEIKKIDELTEEYCKDFDCNLNPRNLWKKPVKKSIVVCAYCCNNPCVCDAWAPK